MARRLTILAIATAVAALVGCTSPTAPTHDCGGGTTYGSGQCS